MFDYFLVALILVLTLAVGIANWDGANLSTDWNKPFYNVGEVCLDGVTYYHHGEALTVKYTVLHKLVPCTDIKGEQ